MILIEGDRIKSVGPAAETPVPAGATWIDLESAVVLPGLIDCHTHLGGRADRYDEINKFKNTPYTFAFAAVINARKTLDAGFRKPTIGQTYLQNARLSRSTAASCCFPAAPRPSAG